MKRVLTLISAVLFPMVVSAAEFSIDTGHSTVGFKIKHLAISSVAGSFTDFAGSIFFDPMNIAAAKAEATISLKSVDTNQAKRDDHLRSPDFFEVEKYPSMTFVSREVKNIKGDSFQVVGDLTIRGITKPVTLDVSYGGSVIDPSGKNRVAFSATTKLNRKDFGLTWNKVLETGGLVVGEDVAVDIEIEGIAKQS